MNNKLNNMLKDFLENNNVKNIDEANEKLQDFIQKYNKNEIEYEATDLDNAYDILDEAQNSKSKKQAKKLAEEAYSVCSDCFDAISFKSSLEKNSIDRMNILNEGLNFEEDRLRKNKFFEDDNMGSFYSIFETRPYIRGLNQKAFYLAQDGKYKLAIELCKEILELNNSDNTGIRYLLMALYACMEDEKAMLSLYEKYQENHLEMLFPLMILYYKFEDYDKAQYYLKQIKKSNSNFIKYYKGSLYVDELKTDGYFQIGSVSEIVMYNDNFEFLLNTVPNISDFILSKMEK